MGDVGSSWLADGAELILRLAAAFVRLGQALKLHKLQRGAKHVPLAHVLPMIAYIKLNILSSKGLSCSVHSKKTCPSMVGTPRLAVSTHHHTLKRFHYDHNPKCLRATPSMNNAITGDSSSSTSWRSHRVGKRQSQIEHFEAPWRRMNWLRLIHVNNSKLANHSI